jgi:hypothetical protein
MSRLFRNRMTATLLGGLALGLPLPASGSADGVPLGGDDRQVIFRGDPVFGLTCDSMPDVDSMAVPADGVVTVVNRTGRTARLLISGRSSGRLRDRDRTRVVFRRGTTEVALDPDCTFGDSSPVLITIMPPSPAAVAVPSADGPPLADLPGLREQSPDPTSGPATIAGVPHLSSAPPGHAPTTTAHRPSPTRSRSHRTSPHRTSPHRTSPDQTSPDQTSPDQTSPDRAGAGLTTPGTSRPSTPHRPSAAITAAAPSATEIKTGTSRRTRTAVLPTADAAQPGVGSGVPNRGGSSPPATSAAAVAVPPTRAAQPAPVAVPSRAATPRQAAAEPVAALRPVVSPEPIGLLALVASVCVVGVGFCAIRTLVSQRAYRSTIA